MSCVQGNLHAQFLEGRTAPRSSGYSIRKSGADHVQKVYFASAGGSIGMDVGAIDVCNGSDYYEIFVFITTAGTATVTSALSNSYFRGMVA